MQLPHIAPDGRVTKIELREGGPVPACIALSPTRGDATYVTAENGIVHNFAHDRLDFFQAGLLEGTPLDLGLTPLGPRATGLIVQVCRLPDRPAALLGAVGMPSATPLRCLIPLAAPFFRRGEWAGIRAAIRDGWPITVVVSDRRQGTVVSARTHRISAAFAADLATDLHRHRHNRNRHATTLSCATAAAGFHGDPWNDLLRWDEDVAVTRHAQERAA